MYSHKNRTIESSGQATSAILFYIKNLAPYSIFVILTLLIMYPLYKHGFIFLLDMVWGPRVDLGNMLVNGVPAHFPVTVIVYLLNSLISTAVIQKIILSLVLFSSGVCMYQLARRYLSLTPAILAGTLYMINPWVYERFLAGQWLVLAGYALFPLFVRLLLQLIKKPDKKNIVAFIVMFTLYPILSIHWAYVAGWFALLLCAVYIPRAVFRARRKRLTINNWTLRKILGVCAITAGIFLVVNSFWLFSFFDSHNAIRAITVNDFHAYQTQADSEHGPLLTVLSLYGFWNNDYIAPKDVLGGWWIYGLVLAVISFIGVVWSWRKKLVLGITAGVAGMLAAVIGVGFAHPITQSLVTWLYEYLPGFKGLRETAKVIGVLAFAYALLVPLGVNVIVIWLKRVCVHIDLRALSLGIYTLAFVGVFSMTYLMFFGFAGQVQPTDYPISWHKAEELLNSDPHTERVLFLPWHAYMAFPFTRNHRVSNPARIFFSAPVVSSTFIDSAHLLSSNQPEWDNVLFKVLHGFETLDNQYDFLKQERISHIILARTADWERYGFLEESSLLERIFTSDDILVYRVGESKK